ncbi:RING-H2 finger protein ATL46-like [Cucurbita maxima]|uniref:RING-H2 finger protein ATL46-like n=1 Tax=Cucurbita maxima TaxID=3661 RepID=A0A6J1K3P6_CUCMA|nr:RING-H2 finger protein ATL46-like [Cucurbita maxima]
MGFLHFAINAQTSSQILHQAFTRILLQFKLLAAHFGLIKPSPELVADSPFERPTSYVLLTEGRYPSLVTVPAVDLQVRIKTSLPIIEYGDFVEKQGRGSPENKVDEENRKCTICLCEMERSETMRELCNCCHVFHRDCLDTWIDEFRITCPVCRSMLFPAGEGDGFPFVR